MSGCAAEIVVHDNEWTPKRALAHPGVEFGVVVDPGELATMEYQFRCERVLDGVPARRLPCFETDILGAGEAFRFVFPEEGKYEVFDVDAPDAVGVIRVTSDFSRWED